MAETQMAWLAEEMSTGICWKWSTARLYIRAYVFSYTRPNPDNDTQTAVKPMTKGREIWPQAAKGIKWSTVYHSRSDRDGIQPAHQHLNLVVG